MNKNDTSNDITIIQTNSLNENTKKPLDDDETIIIEDNQTSNEFFNVEEKTTTKTRISKNKFKVKNPIRELIEKYNLLDSAEIKRLESENQLNIPHLVSSYILNVDKLYKVMSSEFLMRFYNKADNLSQSIDEELISIMNQKKLNIVVLLLFTREEKEEYFILIENPYDYALKDYIRNIIKQSVKINFALSKKDFIKNLLVQYIRDEDSKSTLDLQSDNEVKILTPSDVEDLEYSSKKEVPIIPLVNYIILNAHEQRASDIHIEPTSDNMVVRYRVDGVLHTNITLPINVHREVVSRIKIISDMNVAEKRLPQDGRFSIQSENMKTIDLRISTFPTVYGEKVVLRLLEQDALKLSLGDLDFTPEQLDTFKTKINSAHGLVLITGPTGSGKTTTLYSALASVDKERLNVVTLENPVEYRLNGVNQMQTNEAIGLNFASGLRTVLRQDPDVIMLGEIRDLGTAQMAIRASLTGHMVFSTLHTNDAVGVVVRLVTMGIDPFLVASSLSLVVAQRLLRKVCSQCADTKEIDEVMQNLGRAGITIKQIELLGFDISLMPDFTYGKGCSYCRGSGYQGRQAIFEFFEFSKPIVEEILKKNIDEGKIKELAKRNGMRTLADNAWDLVMSGVTTIEEVVRVIGDD